jgi:predicted dehydrogenase
MASLRVSLIRWTNTFRAEFVGEDGYAVIDGRGGTYGNAVLRFGKRWAWADGTGRSQRETEEVIDFGAKAPPYLEEELEGVYESWLRRKTKVEFPHPATVEEALRVAEACDELYELLAR